MKNFALFLVLNGVVAAFASAAPILFMTDFGLKDDSVAICKGVMWKIDPQAQIVDIAHDVPSFSIEEGARFLAGVAPYYPAGAVFVAVIDPGVGSTRKAIVVKTKRGQYFVVPDNGLLTLIAEQEGIEGIREIKNEKWTLNLGSPTFGGRDIFSPVAAHLSKGDDFPLVGPKLEDIVRLPWKRVVASRAGLEAQVIGIELPYGNLVTNVSELDFQKLGFKPGDKVETQFGKRKISVPFVRTFSDVPAKQPLAYIDSRGRLAFAVNLGNFAETYKIEKLMPFKVAVKN